MLEVLKRDEFAYNTLISKAEDIAEFYGATPSGIELAASEKIRVAATVLAMIELSLDRPRLEDHELMDMMKELLDRPERLEEYLHSCRVIEGPEKSMRSQAR